MCFDTGARPPLLPPGLARMGGGAGDSGDLILTSADGTEFSAAYAHPDGPSEAGVVILPDIRGLHPFYKELAVRFADAGLHAVAVDYFGRTAGTGPRGEDFPFRDHVAQMETERVTEDVAAAVAWLRSLAQGSVRSVFTVGFCLGGSLSWTQSAEGHGLAGCVGFYGRPDRAAPKIAAMRAPLLLLAAGQDHTPVSDVEAFAEQVRAAGAEAELHVYPAAPHSFFDRRYDEHRAACDDAWQRILAFVERRRG